MRIASIRRSFAFRTTLVLTIALIWIVSALNAGAVGPSENERIATGGMSTNPSIWVPTGSPACAEIGILRDPPARREGTRRGRGQS
jgi:hypothetical protein